MSYIARKSKLVANVVNNDVKPFTDDGRANAFILDDSLFTAIDIHTVIVKHYVSDVEKRKERCS